MAFIDDVLQTPSYGWKDEKGELIKPTRKQLFSEFFSRINVFRSKRNWISFIGLVHDHMHDSPLLTFF
jgi:stearoyl-CoA desaturase (delta-9 desaturase)